MIYLVSSSADLDQKCGWEWYKVTKNLCKDKNDENLLQLYKKWDNKKIKKMLKDDKVHVVFYKKTTGILEKISVKELGTFDCCFSYSPDHEVQGFANILKIDGVKCVSRQDVYTLKTDVDSYDGPTAKINGPFSVKNNSQEIPWCSDNECWFLDDQEIKNRLSEFVKKDPTVFLKPEIFSSRFFQDKEFILQTMQTIKETVINQGRSKMFLTKKYQENAKGLLKNVAERTKMEFAQFEQYEIEEAMRA